MLQVIRKILWQINPVTLLNTITVLERVGNTIRENGIQSSNIGSTLVQTVNMFTNKVILPPEQMSFDFQTENITGTVSLHFFCN